LTKEDLKKYLTGAIFLALAALLYFAIQDHRRLNTIDSWAGMVEQERQQAKGENGAVAKAPIIKPPFRESKP
jgi:hypothetical protein